MRTPKQYWQQWSASTRVFALIFIGILAIALLSVTLLLVFGSDKEAKRKEVIEKAPKIEGTSLDAKALTENEDYMITYFASPEEYVISVRNPDFISTRRRASNDFLELLDLTEKEACELPVSVTTAIHVNERFAGREYTLSFCE